MGIEGNGDIEKGGMGTARDWGEGGQGELSSLKCSCKDHRLTPNKQLKLSVKYFKFYSILFF